MEKGYEENMRDHIKPFAGCWADWKQGRCKFIAYGQPLYNNRIHRVWLDDARCERRTVSFLVKDLRACETEDDVVKLFDIAWAQLLIADGVK